MAKKIKGYIKLQIKAGQANPSPPVGPALGQQGVNIMEFCKAFNAATQAMEQGAPIPVVISVYEDKSFTFVTKTPPASFYLKKALGVQKGSSVPNKEKIGVINQAQIREIATAKMQDMNAIEVEAAMKSIVGTALSMGIRVED